MSCLAKISTVTMLILLFSGAVLAHDPGLSAVEVRILPDRIVAEVSFASVDVNSNLAEHLLEPKGDEQILKLRKFTIKTPDTNSIHFILEFPNSPAAELHL